MRKMFAGLIFCVFLMGFIAVAGCTKTEYVYICPNGAEVPDKSVCKTNKVAGVEKRDAESYAKRYVGAYFSPYGGKAQLVSSYLDPDKSDYFATFVVSEKDGEPYETVVSIDGVTGQVNCTDNCDYI